ncbi:hypothetical protein BOX37_00820 [Nocardia mangyaensis]|uniref:Uncharacterized protein n=1 Tax=Nocardia mangyaensis TaxID=2213200 RepID=A0A1J0VL37_9NOCA|nr:hypothetical protein [Nocardia mangyaensis]APE32755.1 hypothetical protein BOX37_00820 [Nocardia mangyaensis]
MKRDNEPMLDLAGGDIGMSRHLAKALKILADSDIDKGLQKQFRDIAEGKASMRDLAQSEAFLRLSDAVVPKALADVANTPADEMQRWAAAGEAILERYRNEVPDESAEPMPAGEPSSGEPAPSAHVGQEPKVVPGTRKPNRDRIVTPDEPDDDDLYYQDRRNKGWLQ